MTQRFSISGARGMVWVLLCAASFLGSWAYLRIDTTFWPMLPLTLSLTLFALWNAQNALLLSTSTRLVKRTLFRTQSMSWDQIQRVEGWDGGIRVVAENARLEIAPEALFSTRDWAALLALLKAHAPAATWDEASQRLLAGHLEKVRLRIAFPWLYLAVYVAVLVFFNVRA